MNIFSMHFSEYIHHIFVYVYLEVVDYLSHVKIWTPGIAYVDVLSSSFDNFLGEQSKTSLILGVYLEE